MDAKSLRETAGSLYELAQRPYADLTPHEIRTLNDFFGVYAERER